MIEEWMNEWRMMKIIREFVLFRRMDINSGKEWRGGEEWRGSYVGRGGR